MAEETKYTVNTGSAIIFTANANLDGTGSLGTVLTAAANGTLVRSIMIKAGSTTQGMVRLFVNDGANSTKLILEVEIPAMTRSAIAKGFEKVIRTNISLKAGYVLKVSTEKAEAFHVSAEGFNWDYNAISVRTDTTEYTANTGATTISTANSNIDGTGTIGTVLTAGSSGSGFKGCKINCITIKAGVTTKQGMVRLFIQDAGSTFIRLIAEIPIRATTKSASATSFKHKISFRRGFYIQAGYKIMASTEFAETFYITADSEDWKYKV